MNTRPLISVLVLAASLHLRAGDTGDAYDTPDLAIEATRGTYDARIDSVILEIDVAGKAGNTPASPVGQLDGAHVLGYVFPTSLAATDVGFGATEGIVALALTSHPDFDDTPLWDENLDRDYANDGVEWHAHWVVLRKDGRVEGGLSVKQFDPETNQVRLPPTNPGMPMYMDSPGFTIVTDGATLRVVVPANRIQRNIGFNFDTVTAFMRVNTSDDSLPMLGVYRVYDIASGDLSLPYVVK